MSILTCLFQTFITSSIPNKKTATKSSLQPTASAANLNKMSSNIPQTKSRVNTNKTSSAKVKPEATKYKHIFKEQLEITKELEKLFIRYYKLSNEYPQLNHHDLKTSTELFTSFLNKTDTTEISRLAYFNINELGMNKIKRKARLKQVIHETYFAEINKFLLNIVSQPTFRVLKELYDRNVRLLKFKPIIDTFQGVSSHILNADYIKDPKDTEQVTEQLHRMIAAKNTCKEVLVKSNKTTAFIENKIVFNFGLKERKELYEMMLRFFNLKRKQLKYKWSVDNEFCNRVFDGFLNNLKPVRNDCFFVRYSKMIEKLKFLVDNKLETDNFETVRGYNCILGKVHSMLKSLEEQKWGFDRFFDSPKEYFEAIVLQELDKFNLDQIETIILEDKFSDQEMFAKLLSN